MTARISPRGDGARLVVALALGVGALALASRARADEAAEARAIFADDRFRFCHEADYPLTADEHAWCPILGETSDICPTLPKACALPPVELGARSGRRHGSQKPGGDEAHDPKDPDAKAPSPDSAKAPPAAGDDRHRPEPDRALAAPMLSGVSQVLFILLIVAFVVIIARAVAKSFVRDRAEPPPSDEPKPDPAGVAAPIPRGPVETDVERLLARARAAAARGDYAHAIDDAYAALLRRLDADGHIEIHPSRTNGDYVRQLRERAELGRAVREVVGEVERVHFGATTPSEGAFRTVIDRVVPLVTRALAAALFCAGVSAVIACSPQSSGDAHETRGGTSPSGTQALLELLAKHDFKARRRGESLSKLNGPKTEVLLSTATLDDATWSHLLTWTGAGGSLVIAGAVPLPPELGLTFASSTTHEAQLRAVHKAGGAVGPRAPAGPALEVAEGDLGPTREDVLVRDDTTYATSMRWGDGRITVFADDRLFRNAALILPENAAFLARFFQSMPPPREVEISDAWTGAGASTPFESVARAELVPVILQLFVLLALLYLWKGTPFARLRDPPAEVRRAFADHARALGLAYGRARASRHVLGLYAAWVMDRLRERFLRSGRRGMLPLAEAIAARTGRTEADVVRVLLDATGARDDAAPPSSFRPRVDEGRAPSKPSRGQESESDFALMRELEGFLAATGRRGVARPSSSEKPPA